MRGREQRGSSSLRRRPTILGPTLQAFVSVSCGFGVSSSAPSSSLVVRQCVWVSTDVVRFLCRSLGLREMRTAVRTRHSRPGCKWAHGRVWAGRGRCWDLATSSLGGNMLAGETDPPRPPLPLPACPCYLTWGRIWGGWQWPWSHSFSLPTGWHDRVVVKFMG